MDELVREILGMSILQRSRKGPGYDYWISPADNKKPYFQDKARLEVSGILCGSRSDINRRVAAKMQQVAKSDDSKCPAVIAVVEFSKPQSDVSEKCLP